jgi:transketolase N-terminal domain/subunit
MTSQHDEWRELGQQLRVDSIRSSSAAGSGHPTSSMSAADLMAVLMSKYLHYDFGTPDDPRNDHLIFSKGHASPLLYAMFKAAGAIGDDEMLTFRRFGSRIEGHPTPVLPWVDVATGSLGQGLPISVGVALAGKRLDRLPYRVWCLCGDSEMAEGSMWEAFEQAGFHGLDNLTAVIDVNRLGQTGPTMHEWDLDAYRRRAEAFGWKAIEIDGHDVAAIDRAYARAIETTGQPTVIIAKTEKGHGVKAVADQPGRHGKPLDDPDAAIEELGGIRSIHVRLHGPPARVPDHDADAPVVRAGHEGGDAQGLRRRAGGAGQGARRRGGGGRRGRQQHVHRGVREGASGSVLPVLHRRAADDRHRGRVPGARLEAVRGDLRRLPEPRLRLRAYGRREPREHRADRLACRGQHRRGRTEPDGAGRPRRVPRRARLDRALPIGPEPDGGPGAADGGSSRDRIHAHDAREDADPVPAG